MSIYAQDFNKIEVVVLGTFHFNQSKDFAQSGVDDIFSRKRQRELKKLRSALASFEPHKIMVENTPGFQGYWDRVYWEYQKGYEPKDLVVRSNEIFQLGVKLAREIELSSGVRCVNYLFPEQKSENQLSEPFYNYYQYLKGKKLSYGDLIRSNPVMKSSFNDFMQRNYKWGKLPIVEHLKLMNSEENLRQLHYFNVLAWMDNNTNNVGAELTSLEYFRNMQIMQNIINNLSANDKRVLVIIGAAHAHTLKDLFASHPIFEVIEVTQFLEE